MQPNVDKTAPIGWIPSKEAGKFDKNPIYLGDNVNIGQTISLQTLDGKIDYTATEEFVQMKKMENQTLLIVGFENGVM